MTGARNRMASQIGHNLKLALYLCIFLLVTAMFMGLVYVALFAPRTTPLLERDAAVATWVY